MRYIAQLNLGERKKVRALHRLITSSFMDGESSEQVQRLVVADLPGALPLETLAWSPVE